MAYKYSGNNTATSAVRCSLLIYTDTLVHLFAFSLKRSCEGRGFKTLGWRWSRWWRQMTPRRGLLRCRRFSLLCWMGSFPVCLHHKRPVERTVRPCFLYLKKSRVLVINLDWESTIQCLTQKLWFCLKQKQNSTFSTTDIWRSLF